MVVEAMRDLPRVRGERLGEEEEAMAVRREMDGNVSVSSDEWIAGTAVRVLRVCMSCVILTACLHCRSIISHRLNSLHCRWKCGCCLSVR